ncbi:hypothetical protein ACH4D4_18570 [Streptomyces pristinaespiralis]|uniref:hypothetical protein n=1 Tax=Streptomyces pristinaespiralis TaxID=38300 RepID=UPI00378793A3
MTWWLRVHMVHLSFACVLACFVLAPLLAGSALPVPSLMGGFGAGIPLPLVLPVAPVCVLLHAMSRAPAEADVTAVRPVGSYRTFMFGCVALVTVSLGLIEAQWLDFGLGLGTARNLVGYLGVGLIVQHFLGSVYGPPAVAAVPVVCALIGLGPGRRPYPWAWPLHEGASVLAAAAALGLFAVGAVLGPRRTAESHP